MQIAVDDAGPGYASMRHVLELRPAFAKLDISLVRGIDLDELRQAMAAGIEYYACGPVAGSSPRASRRTRRHSRCAHSASTSPRATSSGGRSGFPPGPRTGVC